MTEPLQDLGRLCLHTITTKPWNLEQAVAAYAEAGIPHLSVWREHVAPYGPEVAGRILRDSGLNVVSLVRGGFFTGSSANERERAKSENRRVIDETEAIGAPMVVLVCGATPGIPLAAQRQQIVDGIGAVLPHAEQARVKLAIEPLHPMYADSRSAVNTLEQANNMVVALGRGLVGVAVDVYHLWWDPHLKDEIARAGRSIFAFHVCDWRTPTRDLLNDRELMGEGCIDIRAIRGWVKEAGFHGPIEVEIFSEVYWAQEQRGFVDRIKDAYLRHV